MFYLLNGTMLFQKNFNITQIVLQSKIILCFGNVTKYFWNVLEAFHEWNNSCELFRKFNLGKYKIAHYIYICRYINKSQTT